MGYLVSGHVVLAPPSNEAIRAALPSSIGYSLYVHRGLGLHAIDTFSAATPGKGDPFTRPTTASGLPLELPPEFAPLNALYERLRAEGAANGFKRTYVNLSCVLSGALGAPVFTFLSDDDDVDFACVTASGKLARLAARCGGRLVEFDEGALEVHGDASEEDDEEEERRLHEVVAREFERFTGKSAVAFGLGLWDPPEGFGLERV